METSVLGIIGDVHAEDRNLRCVLSYFDQHGIRDVVCVGDIVTGIGKVEACCSILRERNIPTVRGNHDRWLLSWGAVSMQYGHRIDDLSPESQRWLSQLPVRFDIETPLGTALVCHGIGTDDMAQIEADSTDVFVLRNTPLGTLSQLGLWSILIHGHSHRRMVRTIKAGPTNAITVINAGTLRRDHQPCFAVCDFAAREVKFVDLTEDHRTGDVVAVPLTN